MSTRPPDFNDSPLAIRLFGPLEARIHGQLLRPLRSRKGLWLLALLVLRHDRPPSRSWLAGTLWPDSDESQALAYLRQSLSDLRHALGAEAERIQATTQAVRLDLTGAWVDVARFHVALAQEQPAAWAEAVELYGGPLLEACGEEWVFQERAAMEQAYLNALERLGRQAMEQGDSAGAVGWLRRLVGTDALRESAHCDLMKALTAEGDYAAAIQVFRELRLLLREELQTEPSAETHTVYERLRAEGRQRVAGATAGRSTAIPAKERTETPREESQPPGGTASPVQMPEGTVTFLFTDIEESKRHWKQMPSAMRTALERHNALLDQTFRRHGGYVFKTMGDAFYVAFGDPVAAVRAAQDTQYALLVASWPEEAPLRVRIALHAGAYERHNNDYFGMSLNRTAHLLAIAHGGQTILSQTVYDLTRNMPPPDVSFRDAGQRRLRDLQHPEQVYQLLHPALPDDFPALRSLDNLPNNLPLQLSAFIGREEAMAQIRALLQKTRLLTLTGSGGCGKTRLALQTAAEMLSEMGDGVWLVELAALSNPALIPQTTAQALGLKESPGTDILETLTNYLKPRQLVLVLDNCEHLTAACAQMAAVLLRVCPSLHLLATSRTRLTVAGAQTYRVPRLSLPALVEGSKGGGQAAYDFSLLQSEAVRLFLDRAKLVRPDFALTSVNAPAVVQTCHRLDGIPLAIELAAARVRVLSADQIATRLDNSFRLLTGGSQTAPARHQTLRALMDWGHELLTDPERAMLRGLSVFSGGWTLEAVEAIFGDDQSETPTVLDLLPSLIDNSLVVYEERSGQDRYRLLETVRQYAREKLTEAGEEAAWGLRHRDYFTTLAEEVHEKRFSTEAPLLMETLEREHDNCRAALDFCATSWDAEAHLRLVGALHQFWALRGYLREGRARLTAALSRTDAQEHSAPRARALNGAANLARIQNDYAVAHPMLEESREIWRALGEKGQLAMVLNNLGLLEQQQRHYDLSLAFFDESLALMRELGDRTGMTLLLNNSGWLAYVQNDHVRARTRLEECVVLSREIGNLLILELALGNLADVAMKQGDYATARTQFRETLAMQATSRNEQSLVKTFEIVAELAACLQRPRQGVRLFAAAAMLSERKGMPVLPDDCAEYDRREQLLHAALDARTFAEEWAAGFALTAEEALALAREIL